jgi:hypothetical protein
MQRTPKHTITKQERGDTMAEETFEKNEIVSWKGKQWRIGYIGTTKVGYRAKLVSLEDERDEKWCAPYELEKVNGAQQMLNLRPERRIIGEPQQNGGAKTTASELLTLSLAVLRDLESLISRLETMCQAIYSRLGGEDRSNIGSDIDDNNSEME